MFEDIGVMSLLRALLVLIAGWLLARLAGRLYDLMPAEFFVGNARMIVRRVVTQGAFALFAFMALHQIGFDLTVVLGAAGILSVAVGFASQTSASNLISGLFLVAEHAFAPGDVIKVNDVTGEVLSIDLLSVKLRTFDNLFVRIPNENLMKSTVTSMTRFAIRRYDLQVGIAYNEDIRRARDVLMQVAREFHLCLDEPAPLVILQGFGDSSVNMQFSVWAARERFLDVRNGIQERVKEAFDREGIEIPFPHRTLYAGGATAPMPVRIVVPETPVTD